MAAVWSVLVATWALLVQAAPFLLFGFVLAGLLHAFLPTKLLARLLGKRDTRSVLNAALIGAPLPVCSCGVVPLAASLRKQGASRGATSSFLISTPETGVDSISLTWGLIDPLMTIARPLSAIFTAFTAGILQNVFEREDATADAEEAALDEASHSCCHHEGAASPAAPAAAHRRADAHAGHGGGCCGGKPQAHEDAAPAKAEGGCCCSQKAATPQPKPEPKAVPASGGCCCHHEQPTPPTAAAQTAPAAEAGSCCHSSAPAIDAAASKPHGLGERVVGGLRYALLDMFRDLAPYLVIGFLLAGVIDVLLRHFDALNAALASPWAPVVMLIAGIPMYVCAVSATPMVAVLIAQGLTPGAGLVFLLAGPATNAASIVLLTKILGRRAVVIYLVSIAVCALLAGYALNAIYAVSGIAPHANVSASHEHGGAHVLPVLAALALCVLVAIGLYRRFGGRLSLGGSPARDDDDDATAAPAAISTKGITGTR